MHKAKRKLLILILTTLGVSGNPCGVSGVDPPRREVAITFDDLPLGGQRWSGNDLGTIRRVNAQLLQTLQAHGVPAIGFVNEDKLLVPNEVDARIAMLEMWLDAGMTLGNHTFSHLSFQKTPLFRYQDDVIHGEVITRRLLEARGKKLRYFRHPYTSTGPTAEAKAAFEAFLHERGYIIALFTVEHGDFAFNTIYVRARQAKGDEFVKRVRDAYLDHLDTMFTFFETLSVEIFGYEIKQVLMIHANEINADCLDDMLRKLEQRGYTFISLDQAFQDKAYLTPDGYVGPAGISWLHRWAVSKGTPLKIINGRPFPATFLKEPDLPQFISDAYRALE